jgi:hypothetical protein
MVAAGARVISDDLAVPIANPKQLTGAGESVDSPIDERTL